MFEVCFFVSSTLFPCFKGQQRTPQWFPLPFPWPRGKLPILGGCRPGARGFCKEPLDPQEGDPGTSRPACNLNLSSCQGWSSPVLHHRLCRSSQLFLPQLLGSPQKQPWAQEVTGVPARGCERMPRMRTPPGPAERASLLLRRAVAAAAPGQEPGRGCVPQSRARQGNPKTLLLVLVVPLGAGSPEAWPHGSPCTSGW